jgi:hypothetical protein
VLDQLPTADVVVGGGVGFFVVVVVVVVDVVVVDVVVVDVVVVGAAVVVVVDAAGAGVQLTWNRHVPSSVSDKVTPSPASSARALSLSELSRERERLVDPSVFSTSTAQVAGGALMRRSIVPGTSAVMATGAVEKQSVPSASMAIAAERLVGAGPQPGSGSAIRSTAGAGSLSEGASAEGSPEDPHEASSSKAESRPVAEAVPRQPRLWITCSLGVPGVLRMPGTIGPAGVVLRDCSPSGGVGLRGRFRHCERTQGGEVRAFRAGSAVDLDCASSALRRQHETPLRRAA